MSVRIRKMKRRDVAAVQTVAKTSWNATYAGIIPVDIQESFLSKAYSDKMLLKRRRKTYIFIAEVEGNIVGFANYSKVQSDKKCHLHAIYILPEYQSKGIGSRLLNIGMEKLGAKEITLHVERKNENALNFYKKKGFQMISEFDNELDGHTLHTIRMALKN
ncbi:GNAT family N-acetyltransferase [Oceanobacillus luteolus]|uniref:GNAT family N-acetyltransferase n=1 Tax=Oceanobacillus luteolus TaxID=1274358 RepID=UPI00203C32D0|nr:GNAT family N-acetyltransferase [Oceanobacillus luteolus]MCM3739652.1 GNAT family N-acetyltransferase [Oceanobacillus luteolus]